MIVVAFVGLMIFMVGLWVGLAILIGMGGLFVILYLTGMPLPEIEAFLFSPFGYLMGFGFGLLITTLAGVHKSIRKTTVNYKR